MTASVESFFDAQTGTVTYVVHAGRGSACAVIDSVLDYDPKSGHTGTVSADRVIRFIRAQELTLQWILETHAHADHLSAALHLRQQLGGRIAIGEQIRIVQQTFRQIFNLEPAFLSDGSQFDYLFAEDEIFHIGALQARALYVPGHTPADMAYQIDDAIFVGDTLFMPDLGTARCDFPGGDAAIMYRSIRKLLSFPETTKLFMCHDYPPEERAPCWESTVAEQRKTNIHAHDGVTAEEFVAMRTARDRTLDMPTLILPAIQVNIRAGALPPPDDNGVRYLRIPLNVLR
ncbi:MBL fold metallo-hydrolase [Oxalicibacterium faecigallinarum]|uniref:MBL fold metallo-hydrolase n=1 Tax=Oxalicibacterium faecigallinarum TaxID=573741 RepID=A0A8J3F5J7_9BURK|nr:MBL fold metallo-hydrolase [Oxalicibacterium faecigallinarum]GGI17976.1 MBL fold metallo-hydrolase [Oxalicibacterium faecigallinarum]